MPEPEVKIQLSLDLTELGRLFYLAFPIPSIKGVLCFFR